MSHRSCRSLPGGQPLCPGRFNGRAPGAGGVKAKDSTWVSNGQAEGTRDSPGASRKLIKGGLSVRDP